jgi:hypothetical protein
MRRLTGVNVITWTAHGRMFAAAQTANMVMFGLFVACHPFGTKSELSRNYDDSVST